MKSTSKRKYELKLSVEVEIDSDLFDFHDDEGDVAIWEIIYEAIQNRIDGSMTGGVEFDVVGDPILELDGLSAVVRDLEFIRVDARRPYRARRPRVLEETEAN